MEAKSSPFLGKTEEETLPFSTQTPIRRRNAYTRSLVKCALVLTGLWAARGFLLGGRDARRPHFADVHGDPWAISGFGAPGPLKHHHQPPLKGEAAEKLFLSVPNNESALAASRTYATHPHLAGSVEDFEDAKVILELFQTEFGIPPPEDEPIFSAGTPESRHATLHIPHYKKPKAWIDVYYPVMNTPLDHSLQIFNADGESIWDANLEEDGDEGDPDAAKYKDAVPAWHGLSRGGEVEGHLIYANYGTKEDYDKLVEAGVNFTGKIVLARYGAIFRGLKIKGAEDLGAAGVLIYSDPRDDGFVTAENGYDAYPAGPARNPTAVQRGSVQYISVYSGDPSTPGYPAYENAPRTEGSNIPKIPSLPISWANAVRLLEEIGGVDEGRKLDGKTSRTTVKLVNHVDDKITPIWNTLAVIPGHVSSEVVLVGCHRDAWVMGAVDPVSGTVSIHEIVKGFGELIRNGWRPLRTIVFASWDAEEYGLIGSTEWAEDFAEWLPEHVVSYLNLDVSVAGSRWQASASPSLADLIKKTAKDITHPTDPQRTLWDATTDNGPFEGEADAEFTKMYESEQSTREKYQTGISPLGSGSDFTAFLQHLGIASSDQGFGFTPSDAVYHYHSIYDSQRYQEVYADPGFHRHVAVAKSLGLLTLRLADAIILPLNTTQYAFELDSYLDIVEEQASQASLDTPDFSGLRASIRRLQSVSLELDKEKIEAEEEFKNLLDEIRKKPAFLKRIIRWLKKVFRHHRHHHHDDDLSSEDESLRFAHDLLAAYGEPPRHHHRPTLGPLPPHACAEHKLGRPPRHPDAGFPHPHGFPIRKFIQAAKRIQKINKKLSSFERGFISEEGIKDREWYRHLGVAPGKWLGYGATTLPALTEAITIDKDVALAEHEVSRLVNVVEGLATSLQS
ncbi:Zn-dependent exopeptidase [Gloeophyllum trabeum ATCC 11539]|uniref:Zn-dependent exopeptidase n=1 Tax=Gloeophyllum trabeum (strain ATCC 11539 / FP-39264 / Madison 617) TaxID=670483 RepID=S7QH46_GLOTA|nr:Zn-dependent exopeptidase [Gloeophyllum trabeum ATCC 11539]EPQ59121.1 Zn-dependent exopeptidase [Gloeophyllum trabeum ATCC 11539]